MKLIAINILLSLVLSQSLDTCTKSPNSSECSSFKLDDDTINKKLDSLCGTGPAVIVGCSIRQYCKADSSLDQTYCSPFSLLGDICKVDKKDDASCKEYNGLCANNTQIAQCTSNPPMPKLISTSSVTQSLSTICEHFMPSCEAKSCPDKKENNVYNCDQLTDLRNICFSMNTMSQCKGWNEMCTATNNFGPTCQDVTLPSTKPGATPGKSSGSIPSPLSFTLTGLLLSLFLQ